MKTACATCMNKTDFVKDSKMEWQYNEYFPTVQQYFPPML